MTTLTSLGCERSEGRMTPHGIVARHDDHLACSCGAVLYAAGRTAQRRAWFQHSDEERER